MYEILSGRFHTELRGNGLSSKLVQRRLRRKRSREYKYCVGMVICTKDFTLLRKSMMIWYNCRQRQDGNLSFHPTAEAAAPIKLSVS